MCIFLISSWFGMAQFTSDRWIQRLGKSYSLWWMEMCVLIRSKPLFYLEDPFCRRHSWCLWCWRQLFSNKGTLYGLGTWIFITQNLIHCRTLVGISIYRLAVLYASRCVSLFFMIIDQLRFFSRWAIPSCLFFCWLYMRTKYHWTQLFVRYELL